jgi:putative spermidine/putrescine transport system permease protein
MLLALFLLPPLLWLGIVYLGSLFALLAQSFFQLDDFTGKVVYQPTLGNYVRPVRRGQPLDHRPHPRHGGHRHHHQRHHRLSARLLHGALRRAETKALFYVAVMLPLWSNYLVRVYAWRLILAKEGVIHWAFNEVGLGWVLDGILSLPVLQGSSLSTSHVGTCITFVYIWLPYMILPLQAALERVPRSFIEASSDLGAKPSQTFRNVIFPLAIPGIAAGSIFTFSLTLGDYIIPQLIGSSRPSSARRSTSSRAPPATSRWPPPSRWRRSSIMAVYLSIAKRFGAFDAL